MKNKQKNFGEWLLNKYLQAQSELGRRMTYEEWSAKLEVSRPLLSQWIKNVRTPSREYADILASHLGNEVYDVLGFLRPDEDLYEILNYWDNVPREVKLEIKEKVMEYKHSSIHQ